MFIFFSIIIFIHIIFLWLLLIGINKTKSKTDIIIDDNLQMEFLKNYKKKKRDSIF